MSSDQPSQRRPTAKPPSAASPSSPPPAVSSSPLHHPLLPTRLETLLLLLYPGTLLLGSLFSLVSPSTRATPYSAELQSHPDAVAPSYFARKRNVFNVFFVKIGWFWTSLAFGLFLLLHPSTGPAASLALTRRRREALVRYGAVTAWWWLVTQWAFGPGLIDRGFRLTGGICEMHYAALNDGEEGFTAEAKQYVTGAACKLAGGSWRGGHDISGHVFLLVLGSAFLWLETLPVVVKFAGLREERIVQRSDGSVGAIESEVVMGEEKEGGRRGVGAPVIVAALMWWMLLMTAAYFHTWFEKYAGLVVAFMGIFTVYFLPRALPVLRAVFGMPGV